MSSNDVNGSSRRDAKRRRLELFFWEKDGTRYHLRFTRLALLLVVCLTVIPAAAIFAILFTQSRVDFEDVNVNIRTPPSAPRNYGSLIIQTTTPPVMPAGPKAGRSPKPVEPIRQTPAAPNVNANRPSTPRPTPLPTPPKPPG
jgi:predicted secreted protein